MVFSMLLKYLIFHVILVSSHLIESMGLQKEACILKYLCELSPCFPYLIDYEYNQSENIGYMIMELGSGSLRQYLQGQPLNDEVRHSFLETDCRHFRSA